MAANPCFAGSIIVDWLLVAVMGGIVAVLIAGFVRGVRKVPGQK